MREQLEARLTELEQDYRLGQTRLAELDREQTALRETLLRINGAMRVLQELLGTVPESTEPAGANGKRVEQEPVHVS